MILSTTHIPSFWIPFGWYEEFPSGEYGAFALNGYAEINGCWPALLAFAARAHM